MSRYAILIESATNPEIQTQIAAIGGRVDAYYTNWLRTIGSIDPGRHTSIIGNHVTGLILHQLAFPAGPCGMWSGTWPSSRAVVSRRR